MIAIAIASFMEALRKKLFVMVGILTVLYLGLFATIVFFFDKDMRAGQDNIVGMYEGTAHLVSIFGFYFSSMLVAFLTIMASIGSVSSEVESGILHSIITRPINRVDYILGKYFSFFILSTAYSLLIYTSVILICVFFKLPAFAAMPAATFIKGFLFFALQPIALLSLSIFGSVTFKTVTNGIFVIALYILGLIGGIMEQAGDFFKNETLLNLGIFSSLLSPFDVIYRHTISVLFSSGGKFNPVFGFQNMTSTTPSNWMFAYIFLYIIGLVVLAVRKFNKKDIS